MVSLDIKREKERKIWEGTGSSSTSATSVVRGRLVILWAVMDVSTGELVFGPTEDLERCQERREALNA